MFSWCLRTFTQVTLYFSFSTFQRNILNFLFDYICMAAFLKRSSYEIFYYLLCQYSGVMESHSFFVCYELLFVLVTALASVCLPLLHNYRRGLCHLNVKICRSVTLTPRLRNNCNNSSSLASECRIY